MSRRHSPFTTRRWVRLWAIASKERARFSIHEYADRPPGISPADDAGPDWAAGSLLADSRHGCASGLEIAGTSGKRVRPTHPTIGYPRRMPAARCNLRPGWRWAD